MLPLPRRPPSPIARCRCSRTRTSPPRRVSRTTKPTRRNSRPANPRADDGKSDQPPSRPTRLAGAREKHQSPRARSFRTWGRR
jgi:hypothetical protein